MKKILINAENFFKSAFIPITRLENRRKETL